MLKSIKISLKDTIIYGLGNVAVKLVGFLLIPLFTDAKYFPIDQFGVYGILEISALVLTAVMASALPQSLTRWFWDKDYKENQKGIFFMSFTTQIIVSFLFCLLLIPLSGKLSLLLFSKPDWSKVISFVVIGSAIQALNNIVNTLMRLQSRSILYTITNFAKLTIVLTLTLYFIVSKKMGLEGIYLAQIIGNGILVLVLLGYTIKNSRLFFDKTIFMAMNAYGFPLLLANISTVLLNVVDRYSLNSLDILKSVALYTLAFKITSVLKLVIVDSMKLAIAPMMFKKLNTPGDKRFYTKVLTYSSFVLMFAIIAVSLFSFELTKVMAKSKEFWDAVVIIPILAMSVFFVNLKDITGYGMVFAKKSRMIGLIVFLSTVTGLIFNILFIPLWGITGSAIATLLAQIFYFLLCYYFSQKVFYIPYEMKKIMTLLLCGIIISFSSFFVNEIGLLPRIILKTSLFLSYPFVLYLFKFYEPEEINSIHGFISKWIKLRNLKENFRSLKMINEE
jgi:O-antigen/teichoic acid export membrane protein